MYPCASSPNLLDPDLSIFFFPGLWLTSQAIIHCLSHIHNYRLWVPGLLLLAHKVDAHVYDSKLHSLERFLLLSLPGADRGTGQQWRMKLEQSSSSSFVPSGPILSHVPLAFHNRILWGLPMLCFLWVWRILDECWMYDHFLINACLNQGPVTPKELHFKWCIIFHCMWHGLVEHNSGCVVIPQLGHAIFPITDILISLGLSGQKDHLHCRLDLLLTSHFYSEPHSKLQGIGVNGLK